MVRYQRRTFEVEVWRNLKLSRVPQWVTDAAVKRDTTGDLWIGTCDGALCARVGDWVLRDGAGNVYPCAASIFETLYEPLPSIRHAQTA